jgi:NAD(P)-dependent dehydrogenase (short-subunit alcohol dehydrogenase family)
MVAPSKFIVTGPRKASAARWRCAWRRRGARRGLDTQADGAEETARLCRGARCAVARVAGRCRRCHEVEAAVAAFEREWGAPEGLVNNAAIFPRARALDMQLSEWERVLRVNLTGSFLCERAVARLLKDASGGVIVNMASGRALAGAARGAHYSATKGGIIALTKSLALDWPPTVSALNCVIPG